MTTNKISSAPLRTLKASDYMDMKAPLGSQGETFGRAIIQALDQNADLIIDFSDLVGLPTFYFNAMFLELTRVMDLETFNQRVTPEFRTGAQWDIYLRSKQSWSSDWRPSKGAA